MSHTPHSTRRARLQRSVLAVPGSNPTFIDKAAGSAADHVFLDLEDAVAHPDKEQARKNVIAALNNMTGQRPERPSQSASTGWTPRTCTGT